MEGEAGGALDGGDGGDYRCLVRATDGKKKVSTAARAHRPPSLPAPRPPLPRRALRPSRRPEARGSDRSASAPQLAAHQVPKFHAAYTNLQKVSDGSACPELARV